MTNPYLIQGPALISFSGGRTSAYMLKRIIDAHGGMLPDDVHVCFANTGKEREETLRFVHECGVRWNVPITWLEWRAGAGATTEERFAVVGYNSASRNGEPLSAIFKRRKYLPNAVTRFCTAEAKIETMKQFMISKGYATWLNVVGLRADEPHRLLKQVLRNMKGKERWRSSCPLAVGGVIKRHVLRFWLGRNQWGTDRRYPLPQGFDLGLDDHDGNCDACMLKGYAVLAHIERKRPGTLDWWIGEEDGITAMIADGESADKPTGAQFVTEYSYREIQNMARSSAELPNIDGQQVEDCTGEICTVASDGEVNDEMVVWLIDQLSKVHTMPAPKMKAEAAIGDLYGNAA
ncbi:hypothetical protein [uncultured Novosphingobium sp.]|uniref:hypothetical protein n=1 Tax=uncultured Novosphingobium sp. TaxID=292277 RepID=UPI0025999B93|nr:hypothetical protein [uncultured Novosphingobium sp.]